MALVQAVGNNNGAGATTLRVNIASSTAGSCLALFVGVRSSFVTGVADSASNTYTAAYTQTSGTEANRAWVFPNAGAGVTWIEATFSASTASAAVAVEESGIVTSSPVDQTAVAATTAADPFNSGNTATTAQADEIGYGICSTASTDSTTTYASGTDWTAVTGTGITGGHSPNSVEGNVAFLQRRVYTATGAYNSTGTNALARLTQASILTLKVAPTGPSPRIVVPTVAVSMR